MNERDLDRLAELIADALRGVHRHALSKASSAPSGGAESARGGGAPTWLPTPVPPEPPARGSPLPASRAAAQDLNDVAPAAGASDPRARVSVAKLTRTTRQAAAGRGAPPTVAPRGRTDRPRGRANARTLEISVPIGVSNRHVHLSADDARRLLGRDEPARRRDLSQPGQYSAEEKLIIVGPRGRIDGVRVVGPTRGVTQVEIARSDARLLGIEPPVAASGVLDASIGGVRLTGPAGSLELGRGVIIAARHLHLGQDDAARWGLRDGDTLDVRCGEGARAVTWHGVLVRSGPGHATELHLDVDEAHAAHVRTGDRAVVVSAQSAGARRRPLITEGDVQRIARAGGSLPDGALLTPSARDRARALGLEGGA